MGGLRFETLATALVSLSLALGCSSGRAIVGTADNDAGGGDVADDAAPGTLPDFADGTRLKALTYVLDDGTKVWRGWWDSQRNEQCWFGLASDGKTRCLPAAEPIYAFSDSRCTSPLEIVFGDACGPLPPYLEYPSTSSQSCSAGEFHKRLAKVARPLTWYSLGSGTCTANAMNDDPAGTEYWTGGDLVATGSFVAAEEFRDARGPGLMARYYRAEDGALQLLGAYDVARARDCAATPYVPGACLPDPLPYNYSRNEFSDSACTKPTADLDLPFPLPCGAMQPDYILESPNLCSTISKGRVYKLGAPYAERPFLASGTTCAQSDTNKTGTASANRREVEEVPLSAFPAARFVDEGQGRIKVRTVETEDGHHLAVTTLIDSVAGGTCTPFLVDGTLRCLPDDPLGSFPVVFVDPECKQRGYVRTGGLCDVPVFVTDWNGDSCTRTPHYYEVGPAMAPQQTFMNTTGTCMDAGPLWGTIYPVTERSLNDAPLIGTN